MLSGADLRKPLDERIGTCQGARGPKVTARSCPRSVQNRVYPLFLLRWKRDIGVAGVDECEEGLMAQEEMVGR